MRLRARPALTSMVTIGIGVGAGGVVDRKVRLAGAFRQNDLAQRHPQIGRGVRRRENLARGGQRAGGDGGKRGGVGIGADVHRGDPPSEIHACLMRLWLMRQAIGDPCVRVGVLGDVGNDGDGIGAGGENLRGLLELDAADRDQRDVADALLPFGDFRNALRRKAHRFQRGRKDRPERDIVGFCAQRGCKLFVVMGGDAERQAGIADRVEVGIGEVFLAEMQMLCAGDDRGAPVIVDHELCRACPWSLRARR